MDLKDFSQRDLEVLKAVATTSQGFNAPFMPAIHLDPLAKLAYNIYYSELKKIPHIQPEMGGQRWGGTSYQWGSILAPNASSLPAPVSPGNRNQVASVTQQRYSAPYATLGFDQSVQEEEFEQERGFDDPIALARISTMHNILKQYDTGVLAFNRGPDSNGFALGSANTPSLSASASGGTLAYNTDVTVYCVELTAYGALPYNVNQTALSASGVATSTSKLIPFYSRTPANASSAELVPNGVGMPSSSASVTVSGSTSSNSVTAAVVAKAGAMGWAWFVSVNNSPSASNAYFYGITTVPGVVIQQAAASTQTLAAFNVLQNSTDTSYNGSASGVSNSPAPEFDGVFAYIVGANPGNFIQMNGAGWTPNGAGGVEEIDAAVQSQYLKYQAVPDEIVCGVEAITPITQAVLQGGPDNFFFMKGIGPDGAVEASTVIRSYRLKFSSTGEQKIIPVSVNPNVAPNAVYLPVRMNPFPSTSSTIPAALQLAEIRPMWSEDFAHTRRTWEIGTYVMTTLVNRAPFLGHVFSGAANVVNS